MPWLLRNRFLLLSCVVVALMASHTRNQHWTGDFWEHAAVVRELATHPAAPRHPQLSLNAPHAFFTPYALLLGLVSRFTNAGAIGTLSAMGLFNLCLLLFALRLFVALLSGEGQRLRFGADTAAAAFYGLLCLLLLWGRDPWLYSGFLHLNMLGLMLPYPSMFALALMFLSFAMHIACVRGNRRSLSAVVAVVFVTILLVHPLTAIMTYVGLWAFSIGVPGPHARFTRVFLPLLFPASVLVATAWPYYPFLTLAFAESRVFDGGNSEMYEQLVRRSFLPLLCLPFLASRLRSNRRDPLCLMFAVLGGLYLYGAASGRWNYGRTIAGMFLCIQLATGQWLAHLESTIASASAPMTFRKLAFGGIVLCGLAWGTFNFGAGLRRYLPAQSRTYGQYLFLPRYTGQYDVTLADTETAWPIPAIGGKIVATLHPVAFVPDAATRRRDVRRFFSPDATLAERMSTLDRYKVKYVLVNQATNRSSGVSQESFARLGRVVHAEGDFTLIEVTAGGEGEVGGLPLRTMRRAERPVRHVTALRGGSTWLTASRGWAVRADAATLWHGSLRTLPDPPLGHDRVGGPRPYLSSRVRKSPSGSHEAETSYARSKP